MIAADTSSLVGLIRGDSDPRVGRLAAALRDQTLCLPPPVITEMRSGRQQHPRLDDILGEAPMLPLADGFWHRAGEMRRILLLKGLKARTVDTLIAQCCIDAGAPLIALDSDFRHFEAHCGLKLA